MANLSLSHVNKVYDNGFEAVKDFNLEIEDKEFIIFVGPSGCGKSTTLRMIAGLEDISSGELKIDGKVMNDVEPKDRDIAMVFQNYALYPHMTVFDNMAFGLKLRKLPKEEIKEKVVHAAKILDLEHLLDRKPSALSGGQRQRVAMGRAILRNPKVFLMDEPLSNLDAKLRVQMRQEISKLHRQLGTTIIYVTHDQTEAMTLGTRIVVMKDGVVQQIDTPYNLYNKPKNIFFYGNTGVGKTFLSNCIAKELLDAGYSVIYFTAFQLFDILSKGVFEKDADAIAAHQNIFDCDLLIIDDLGTELSNSFTTSQLFLCVNERILRQKSTIISTNLNLEQIAEIYSERTLSRISSNYSFIKLFGDDIRIKKRLSK